MSKQPQQHSREWFDQWCDEKTRRDFAEGCFKIRRSESVLRMIIMKAEADRERFSAETVSYRKIALRLQKLQTLWYEANCRAGNARGDLILLLRLQGRHDEADELMPRKRQGNDRTRAAHGESS